MKNNKLKLSNILKEVLGIRTNVRTNVRTIKYFHPKGDQMPDTIYYVKGEILKECYKNSISFISPTKFYLPEDKNNILIEGISREQFNLPNYSGGVIIFSTDINAVKLSSKSAINWIKQKILSFKNMILKDKKLINIIKKHNLSLQKEEKLLKGIGASSIGNFFKGKYTDIETGTVYTEKSASLEILGIPSDVILNIATDICREFNQQTVLVKDYNSNKFYLVDQE